MSEVHLKLMAAERKTEHVISDMCSQISNTLNYIDEHSNVTTRNVVEMQQVVALLENAEYYALQANLLLLTINKKT